MVEKFILVQVVAVVAVAPVLRRIKETCTRTERQELAIVSVLTPGVQRLLRVHWTVADSLEE